MTERWIHGAVDRVMSGDGDGGGAGGSGGGCGGGGGRGSLAGALRRDHVRRRILLEGTRSACGG